MNEYISKVYDYVVAKNPDEAEFHQAVKEIFETIEPVFDKHPILRENRILERIVEPERQIIFRVPWIDDNGEVRVNRGYRVQFNSAIGPYKGGLRFHPSVYLGIIKFLGFEQIFKNALTGLPLGGGKGGSDFDPKGKTDNEVMKFCQSFINEFYKYMGIGGVTDIPAGDIGVGRREIGYMFGQYKRITHRFEGVVTGKGLEYGGSLIRKEATGYGATYFLQQMLKARDNSEIKGKTFAISGSGNVAQYALEKVIELGGKVVTLSDSNGYIYDPEGITNRKKDFVFELKQQRRGRIKEYAEEFNVDYYPNKRPWDVKCDVAFPCATQNEISGDDAQTLVDNGCFAVVEGANMPSRPEAIGIFLENGVSFAPAKAANAGGVAVSGLEMSQNALKIQWSREEVENKLREIMHHIHKISYDTAKEYSSPNNYLVGANISGFLKVAFAMLAQGVV